ncbi:MAG: hypothetical protein DRO67_05250, partial [Candidatus Asgardarchaeum californiense]
MAQLTAQDQRRSQNHSLIAAFCIFLGLLLAFPASAGFADWMNENNAPDVGDTNARFVEADTWDGVTFNMDSTAFKNSGSFKSRYIWENASGGVLYSNITHAAGIITTTIEADAGNASGNITNDLSWTSAIPYYEIYFAYTAKEAYDDNVVQIWLQLDGISNTQNKARTVTLSCNGVTFYTTTFASDNSEDDIDHNITI